MKKIEWKTYKRILDVLSRIWLALICWCVHIGISYMCMDLLNAKWWAWTAFVVILAITVWAFKWTFDNYDYEDRFDDYVLDKAEQKRWVEHAWKCLNKRNEKDQ